MTEFLLAHGLDITTTALGLAYIFLEYKASIWLWIVGFFMQALDIILYYQKGLYADCAMEFYYIAMTIYGLWAWKFGHKRQPGTNKELAITHFAGRYVLPWTLATLAAWAALWQTPALPREALGEYGLWPANIWNNGSSGLS